MRIFKLPFINLRSESAPTSESGEAVIKYDSALDSILVSKNGAAFDLLAADGGLAAITAHAAETTDVHGITATGASIISAESITAIKLLLGIRDGITTIDNNTFDIDLSTTSTPDQRRAADGAVTFGVDGMVSGIGVNCYITNTTESDLDISVIDDISWDGAEAPPSTLGTGLTLTVALYSLGTTSESVQGAWMVGEVPA